MALNVRNHTVYSLFLLLWEVWWWKPKKGKYKQWWGLALRWTCWLALHGKSTGYTLNLVKVLLYLVSGNLQEPHTVGSACIQSISKAKTFSFWFGIECLGVKNCIRCLMLPVFSLERFTYSTCPGDHWHWKGKDNFWVVTKTEIKKKIFK